MPGALLVGDAAGTLDVVKIKGVHMAIRAGMLAAEHFAEFGRAEGYDAAWHASSSRHTNCTPSATSGPVSAGACGWAC
jgi:electron-transferring-flavoprotein dehydrogenase